MVCYLSTGSLQSMSNKLFHYPLSFVEHLVVLSIIGIFLSGACNPIPTREKRPNILLIVADDMAYSDLGCYGSEIHTPNLDRLAREGILFTRFHAGPQCAPSRAMLLTGTDNHMAGVGRQDVPEDSKWFGQRGYERNLSDRIIPFPGLLQEAGYFTCISGKWHLGYDTASWPDAQGFERSFAMLNGGSNHFMGIGLGVEKTDTVSLWVEDARQVSYPDGRYSTELHTDNIVKYIKENHKRGDKPFFAYTAYTSPHWPLQVPEEWLYKYSGVYDRGYEVLKVNRFKALKAKGFIQDTLSLPPYAAEIIPWKSLDQKQRKVESRKMELYAAMVENLDHHFGRLRDSLKSIGLWDNTVVIFLSDNGAAHRDFYAHPERGKFLRSLYDNSYDNMGRATSFVSYGRTWAMSCMVPFKLHKIFTTEGGMIVPAIIAGPGVNREGRVNKSYVNIMDLAPTILELAGIDYNEIYKERGKFPMRGNSLMPILHDQQEQVHTPEESFALEFNGSIYFQEGQWKLVNYRKPYSADNFELYDIISDPGEQYDLRNARPQLFDDLLKKWQRYQEENQILLQTEEEARKFNY